MNWLEKIFNKNKQKKQEPIVPEKKYKMPFYEPLPKKQYPEEEKKQWPNSNQEDTQYLYVAGIDPYRSEDSSCEVSVYRHSEDGGTFSGAGASSSWESNSDSGHSNASSGDYNSSDHSSSDSSSYDSGSSSSDSSPCD